MIRRVFPIAIVLVFGCISFLEAQVNVGLNPPTLEWKQIEDDNFRIIFPQSRETEAQRVANLLTLINQEEKLLLGSKPKKVPIILQNQTTIANGFVTLQPWRSEFFLNPPQFQFANAVPWIDLLTIHEYRHVQQVSEARNGTPGKLLYAISGQGGWALNAFGIQPRWFLEGDAVYAETMYTSGGRGRTPDFLREYQAMRLAGLHYNYEKAAARSFKDFVPSHYHLGYLMTANARRNHGEDIWEKVLTKTYKGIGLYRFSNSLKKLTGKNTKNLYRQTVAEVDSIWSQKDQQISVVPSKTITKPSKTYTNYRLPQFLNDGTLIVRKTSFKEIAAFYELDLATGEEKRITRPGLSSDESLSVGADKVAWSEGSFHPRWTRKDYSIIRVYDLKNRAKIKLTSRSKLFVPALSPRGDQIVAVTATTGGLYFLTVLDIHSGAIIKELPNADNSFLTFPKWSTDGQSVIYLAQNGNGNQIRSVEAATGKVENVSTYFKESIGRLVPHNDLVYFSASFTGIQNIFALDRKTGAISQVTSSRWGAYFPALSPDGNTLAFSDYTAQGFQIHTLALAPASFRPVALDQESSIDYHWPLLEQEFGNMLDKTPTETFGVSNYNQWWDGLFRLHSWLPVVTPEEYGLEVQSDNLMSTLSVLGQVTYNTDQATWKTLGRLSYGAVFPVFDFEVSTGQRTTHVFTTVDDSSRLVGYRAKWRENLFTGGIRLPLNLTHNNNFSNLNLFANYQQFKVKYLDGITDRRRNEYFGGIELGLNFYRLQTPAPQNINPRFGQVIDLAYQNVLTESANQGSKFSTNGTFYFPGIFRNHSFYLGAAYKKEDIVNAFRFEDTFIQARGYPSFFYESIYRLSANYSLPLWYPDLALGSIMFIKRFKANFFYDYSKGTILETNKFVESSVGVDLTSDFRLIRLINLDLGVRFGYMIDSQETFINFLLLGISF